MTNFQPDPELQETDAVVVGSGPAGMAAALALAFTGVRVAAVGQSFAANPRDTRTTALLQASVRFLINLGVWDSCRKFAAPLEGIRLLDDTGQLLRAPEIAFHYSELGTEPFGFNIANTHLVEALAGQMRRNAPAIAMLLTPGASLRSSGPDGANVEIAPGESISARLVAAADGRASICREAAGISAHRWSYDQGAIACSFTHTADHKHYSNEFHRPNGPLTTVPLPGKASSLVWVERTEECTRLMQLDETDFTAVMGQRLHGILGRIQSVGPRAMFPLSGLTPTRFAQNRVALIGEAAHVLPPIGAQGLNLGFRDAAALAEIVGDAVANGEDPGGDTVMDAYHRARRGDVLLRTAAVDTLNRSLLSPLLPVHAMRSTGLHLLNAIGPLRRLVMRRGLAPAYGLPALMRQD